MIEPLDDEESGEVWAGGRKARPPIPVEILSEIILLVSKFPGDKLWNWRVLMLVCHHWHAVILSTPGLHSQLIIRRATQKEVVQVFIRGRKTRLGVSVDVNDEGDGSYFDAENFHACFMAAIQAASRWSSLNLISPPPHGEYKDLQILQPLTHLESFTLACGSGEFFEQLVTAIIKNAPPNLTAMGLSDPAAVLRLVQPASVHIYHYLTTLKIQLFKRIESSIDILPHLQRLETLEACRLLLPFYSPDPPLPLIQTLRFLYLKSVSVQWMAGRTFPSLERCRIIFPHHADTLQAFQPVTMPSCSFLLYHSNVLHPLTQFRLPSLDALDVGNAQWNVWRGNLHLVNLCSMVAATSQRLTLLRLDVRCSEQLLVYMLKLAPVLEELWLGLSHPNALSKTFFHAFIVREPINADSVSAMGGPPSRTICPSLKSLHLHYRRWMRGPDKKSLIVTFSNIVESREQETVSSFLFVLSFDEALEESHWTIGKPTRKFQKVEGVNLLLGIATPHATITLSTLLPGHGLVTLPFKKVESLHLFAPHSTCLEFRFTRDHMELMVYVNYLPPPSSLYCALPLFHALRVLVMKCDNLSFLAGHTFHMLEKCRLLRAAWVSYSRRRRTLTGMPVCTKVDIDNPWALAAFKLPQIRELALEFSDPDCNVIWEKHIAVNANLSGLNLLHLKNWLPKVDLTPILRSVPFLETLIIAGWHGWDSLRVFLPIDAKGTSRLKRTRTKGKTFAVLCPRLRHLQIEGRHVGGQPDRVPFAKDIITLRAECGSPLNVLTVSEISRKPGRKFEFIGRDGSFTVQISVLADKAEEFKLDI